MSKQETKIFNLIQDIKKEELVKNTLAKIEEIVRENRDKDVLKYCFITSPEVWLGIAEHWGISTKKGTWASELIPTLRFRGFAIYFHKGFQDRLFFGKLYMFEEPLSVCIHEKLEERLWGDR